LIYGEGISREGSIIDMAAESDIIAKSGAWYSYNGERLGQGRENAKDYLRQNPEIAQEIESKVREMVLGSIKKSKPQEDIEISNEE